MVIGYQDFSVFVLTPAASSVSLASCLPIRTHLFFCLRRLLLADILLSHLLACLVAARLLVILLACLPTCLLAS